MTDERPATDEAARHETGAVRRGGPHHESPSATVANPDPRPEPEGENAVLDARGLRCPLPVIRLAALVRDRPEVTAVVVLATDPAAAHDVPAWCRMRGHTFVGTTTAADGAQAHEVRLSRPPATRHP